MGSELSEKLDKNKSLILVILFFISVASLIGFIHLIVIPSNERAACCGSIIVGINVDRISNDSIKLTVRKDDQFIHAPPLVMIYLDDNEISNMSVIKNQGLPYTIDPPEGLEYKSGNSAIIRGIEITGNQEKTHRLKVYTRHFNPYYRIIQADTYI
jgi:hypothetical protein